MLLLSLSLPELTAATVTWNGKAGDNTWETPLNWGGEQLPGAQDDVVVSAANQDITVSSSATVRGFSLAQGVRFFVRGQGVTFAASGAASVDGAGLWVSDGARLSLPGLKQFSAANVKNADVSWGCEGTNSVLELTGLTNVVGSTYPAVAALTVRDAGRMILGGTFSILGGRARFRIEGTNSVLQAPGLQRVAPKALEFYVLDGAQVSLSGLREWSGAAVERADAIWLSDGAGSLLDLPALTNWVGSPDPWITEVRASEGGRVRLDGEFKIELGGVHLAAEGTNSVLEAAGLRRLAPEYLYIEVREGGRLSLPALREYAGDHPDRSAHYWACDGTGSVLDVAGLTNFVGSPHPWVTQVAARTGGRITLAGAYGIGSGGLEFYAQGTNSLLELPGLRRLAPNYFDFGVTDGGRASLPDLQDYSGANLDRDTLRWYCQDPGSAIEARALTNLAGAPYPRWLDLTLRAGGRMALGGSFSILGGGVLFTVDGTNTFLQVPSLERLAPERFEFDVSGGAQVSLPGLRAWDGAKIDRGDARWVCYGAGSGLDLPGLTNWVGSDNPWVTVVAAQQGGKARLGGEFSIPSGGVRLFAEGTNSVLEAPGLRRLTPSYIDIYASGAGRVTLADLREYSGANPDRGTLYWSSTGPGSVLEIAGVTKFVGTPAPATTSLAVRGGGRMIWGGDFSIVDGNVNFAADDANSVLEAPGLHRLATRYPSVRAGGGGRISFPALRECLGSDPGWGTLYWSCFGAGSVLEIEGLTNFAGSPYPGNTDLTVRAGGRVTLNGNFSILGGSLSVTVDGSNSVVQLAGLERLAPEQFQFNVSGGAQVSLPGLREWHGGNLDRANGRWVCYGPGSLLDLPGLTNLVGSLNPWLTEISAQDGGHVKLGGEFSILSGGVRLFAAGTNSVFEAEGLRQLAPSYADIFAAGRSRLSLPNLREYTGANPDRGTLYWGVNGTGSVVEVAGLTNFVGSPHPAVTDVAARAGGRITFGGEFSILSGGLQFAAEGTNSVLEAPALRRLAPNALGVYARSGGRVSFLGLKEYWGAGIAWGESWDSQGSGSVLEVGGLTNFVGAPEAWNTRMYADEGGRVSLGGTFDIPSGDISFNADGAGSLFEAPGLRRVTADHLYLSVANGGRMALPGLREVLSAKSVHSAPYWTAEGAGSRLEMPGLTNLVAPRDQVSLWVTARGGAQLLLNSVPSISGGNVHFAAEGTGSVVDLSSVTRFDTPQDYASLQTLDSGSILLPPIFLLRGASISGVAAWGLPAITANASSDELLCASPGLSVAVEARPIDAVGAPWQRLGRIAMTTNQVSLRPFFAVPDGLELRVRELLADPPELELHPGPAGTVRLTVFGLPSASYRLDSSPSLFPAAVWAQSGRVKLTHPFEQIDITVSAGNLRLFRAMRE